MDTVNHFNPAIIDQTKVATLRAKYGIKEGDFVIGYSGRLVRDKGIIELVRAFDQLQDADNCKLLLVGMFEVRDALPEDVQERIKNDKRIIFTGFINGGMEYYYLLMNVYVLASYRAAMGISQVSDAHAIIVSEETGGISVAYKGQFYLRLNAEELESLLTKES